MAVYIFIDNAGGWWTKPSFASPLTAINQFDSTWTTDITTGGIDEYATRIIAFLVPDFFNPPLLGGIPLIPDTLFQYPYTIESRINGSRKIEFSGYDWVVKKSDSFIGQSGPGPNYFSDDTSDVWVDSMGLHLNIVKKDNIWYASEVVIDTSFGYGIYRFQIAGRVDLFDPNIVLGMFTWDDCAPYSNTVPNNYFREMDFEFSTWGDPVSNLNAQFVIQPWDRPGNRHRFDMGPTARSTHYMTWKPDSIIFESAHGLVSYPPPQDSLIESWFYTGQDLPVPENENIRINFWLIFGNSPLNGENAEFIIKDFKFFFLPGVVSLDPYPAIDSKVPQYIWLSQNYPNPFNPSTTIEFDLPKTSQVTLKIFNIIGEEVAIIVSDRLTAGSFLYEWDSSGLASGIYLYMLQAGDYVETKKMILLK